MKNANYTCATREINNKFWYTVASGHQRHT